MKKNIKNSLIQSVVAFVLLAGLIATAKADYIDVNGLKMYYEVHGTGRPLLLLHGAFMTANLTFGQLTPELVKTHKVILVELQGHGHTADIDRPLSFEQMADDAAALLKYLKIDSADVLGFSMGGGVAAQLAIRHPELVGKIIIVSSPLRQDGWSEETRAVFPTITGPMFEGSPLKQEYDRVAPDPKHWNAFADKIVQAITRPYNYTPEIAKTTNPFLIISGDSDGIRPEAIAELWRAVGGGANADLGGKSRSQLAILPATAHTGIMLQTDRLLSIIVPFLDETQKIVTTPTTQH